MKRFAVCAMLFIAGASFGADAALLRIDRQSGADRRTLLERGVPIIEELEGCFLALGAPGALLPVLAGSGFSARVLDRPAPGETYHLIGIRDGYSLPPGASCGQQVWAEDNLIIVKVAGAGPPPCAGDPAVRWSPLRPEVLAPPKSPSRAQSRAMAVHPLVRVMVDGFSDAQAGGALQEVVGWASSRHSFHPGCRAAAAAAAAAFAEAGLAVAVQEWSGSVAPNIVAELRGESRPDEVVILIAHLDDMPELPPAPGANDNASGSAMVIALARAMAPYRFAGTIKFILVTGEEQGLWGSTFYANDAEKRGEDIRAVLNADMIGWEGDGRPEAEDLDINYDENSEWLADLMVETAGLYSVGVPINAFFCSSMVYSDHAPFWRGGWPALCGITDNEGFCRQKGSYPYYHTHSDTIANCGELSFFAAASRAYLAAAAHLAVPLGRRDGLGLHARPVGHP